MQMTSHSFGRILSPNISHNFLYKFDFNFRRRRHFLSGILQSNLFLSTGIDQWQNCINQKRKIQSINSQLQQQKGDQNQVENYY